MSTKKEYLKILQLRYKQCKSRQEKSRIIDEYLLNTGIKNRKSAIRALNRHTPKYRKRHKGAKIKYTFDLIKPLRLLWIASGKACSKNLQPLIPELLRNLEKFDEIHLFEGQKEKLLSMSTYTIDKLLKNTKLKNGNKLISGTRTSPLLKQIIPIRTNFDTQVKVGDLEIDCVLHCGSSLPGKFAETLNMVDISTMWTARSIFLKKTKYKVIGALHIARKLLFPFPIRSIDFDNGFEFVNYALLAYCKGENITYTRPRSYHSNDQAHIEERNRTRVRDIIGHERIDNPKIVDVVADIYANELHLLSNFFWPVRKIIKKEKKGGKYIKKYDKAKTPYQRVLESAEVDERIKLKLKQQYS